jgi:hypothetical protein
VEDMVDADALISRRTLSEEELRTRLLEALAAEREARRGRMASGVRPSRVPTFRPRPPSCRGGWSTSTSQSGGDAECVVRDETR